jgi:serine/threonine-protein kinase
MSTEPPFHDGLDSERWRRLEGWFDEAMELAADARAVLLARLEAEDPALVAELAGMLCAHDTGTLAIEEGLLASDPAGRLLGRRIGPYRVLELIGRGGMGEVYLAERDDQYRQRVALKVVRAGLAGRDLHARFRAERQILARLTHPNIARLLDGGVTEDGRPYLVMEHVAGIPVDAWCDQRRASLRERLALLLAVCRAVEVAHRSLIVHRDLKPANILVTASGEVKLLDFGIAKLLDSEASTAAAGATGTLLGLMTPEHASPEQVRGEPVTTTTDVYALGVLLYALLCGRKPHAREAQPLAELLREICERDPPLPSLAVGRSPVAEEVAAARATTVARLRRRLAGDLDAIAERALRKEPERRYPSVAELAADLERHLEGRPVRARQGTTLYRAGRFLRRHAAAAAAASLFVLLLAGFSVVTQLQSRQLARERDRARAERDTAEQVARVLVDLFEASDPTKVPGGDALTVRELLVHSEARVLRELAGNPRVQARVRRALGEMYLARSDLDPAERHLRAALAQQQRLGERAEWAAVYHQLALLERRRGSARAVPMLRRFLALRRQLDGADSAAVAAGLQDLAEALPPREMAETGELLRAALAMRRRLLPATDPDIASSLHALGIFHLGAGRHAAAERLLREALVLLEAHAERGPDHPETLATLGDLAVVHNQRASYGEAEALQREVLARQSRVFGAESPAVANALNTVATTQALRGDLDGAAASYVRVRALHARLLGPDHYETANATRNLARVRELQGRYEEALPLMREALGASRRRDGDGNRMTLVMRGQLGVLLVRTGAREEGLAMARQAYTELAAMFPHGHAHVADTAIALVRALAASGAAPAELRGGELGEAESLARRALAIRAAQLAADHPKLAEARCWLAVVLAMGGRGDTAAPLLEESLPLLARWGAADPADLAEARRRLAEAHAARARG